EAPWQLLPFDPNTPKRTSGYDVTRSTATGLVTRYSVKNYANGDELRARMSPDGLPIQTTNRANGTSTTLYPDGTRVDRETTADPRNGLWSKYVSKTTTILPISSLTKIESESRALGSDGVSQLITRVVNGSNSTTMSWDAPSHTETTSSPEGRR